jgi:hypothetical protein
VSSLGELKGAAASGLNGVPIDTYYAVEEQLLEHVIVYRKEGRYGGWPANNGVWNWGDEIVVGFSEGSLDRKLPKGHPIKGDDQSGPRQARSTDGGLTWAVERAPHLMPKEMKPIDCPGDITFTQNDFAMKVLCSGVHAGAKSWFYISHDRCTSWEGPYKIPMFGLKGIAGRTDYQVLGASDCILFLTSSKPDGYEGRAFCARTTDGGRTFQFQSWIGPELTGWTIMPASVMLPKGRLLAALRCDTKDELFIDVCASDDLGKTWQYMSRPDDAHNGNPPAMVRLSDGRVALTYGRRREPFGIRARISDDDGRSWSDEIILRDDGGGDDLGYSRTVERSDGKIVTMYYYNDPVGDGADTDNSERYIAATIWEASCACAHV